MADSRDDDARSILRDLIAISRRGVADARRVRAGLTQTDQSLLSYIVDHPGSRATDLAAGFRLNRSTVSRQLAGLVRLGLVRELDTAGRGRPLELTERGMREYRAALELLQRDVAVQLAGWSDEEVARFAADLRRFDTGGRVRRAHRPLANPDQPS